MAYESSTSFPVPPKEDVAALLKGLGLTGKPLPGPFLVPKPNK
ncbi:MAG: hypothetical protein WC880_00200 [Candidatus Paceibacterota bacterium]